MSIALVYVISLIWTSKVTDSIESPVRRHYAVYASRIKGYAVQEPTSRVPGVKKPQSRHDYQFGPCGILYRASKHNPINRIKERRC